MKNLAFKLTFLRLILIYLLSTSMGFAVQVVNEQFQTGLHGYTGSNISHFAGSVGFMDIARDTRASKTYNLGIADANVSISVRFWVPNGWEDSGAYEDFFEVYANGNIIQSYKSTGGYFTQNFTATTNAVGAITIGFVPNSTANNEFGSIDYILIDDGTKDPVNEGYRDFTLRYQTALPGNILTIGNTALVAPTDQSSNICDTYTNGSYISDATLFNSQYELCEYHVDGTQSFGTTKAEIKFRSSPIAKHCSTYLFEVKVTSIG